MTSVSWPLIVELIALNIITCELPDGTDPSSRLQMAPGSRKIKKNKRKLLPLGQNNSRQQYRLGSDRLESGFTVEATYIIYSIASTSSVHYQ